MRFYKGYMYDIWTAVYPEKDGICYQIMDVWDDKSHKPAFIKVGYDRELKVKDNAKLLWTENKKDKVVSIPFVKEDGRLVFDLPAYLKERKVKFKLYKKRTNCAGDSWYKVVYQAIVSSAGEIAWGSDWCIDYREYWLNITYQKNYPEMEGRRVKQICIDRETNHMDREEILTWFQNSMEEKKKITYADLGKILEQWGLRKESPFMEIRFRDGSRVTGCDLWETEK